MPTTITVTQTGSPLVWATATQPAAVLDRTAIGVPGGVEEYGKGGGVIVDNGDGTFTASGTAIVDNGDGTFSIGGN